MCFWARVAIDFLSLQEIAPSVKVQDRLKVSCGTRVDPPCPV